MIYLTLGGGLGNQMFQLAFAKKISLLTGQQIVLNEYHIARDTLRSNSLGSFQIEGLHTCNQLLGYLIGIRIKLVGKLCTHTGKVRFQKLRDKGYFIETNVYSFCKLEKSYSNRNIFIEGGFQTPLYFDDIKDEVRNMFCLNNGVKTVLEHEIENGNAVCVHIRRGDYLAYKDLNICTYEYYYRGMKYIRDIVKNPIYYIFAPSYEDIAWIKENYDFSEFNVVYVDQENTDYNELKLMSRCRHFVISNSTFSWWAQYLGRKVDSIVVAPENWNLGAGEEQFNIYQRNWKIISI